MPSGFLRTAADFLKISATLLSRRLMSWSLLSLCVVLLTGCQWTTRNSCRRVWLDMRNFHEPALYWERSTLRKPPNRNYGWFHWDRRQFVDTRIQPGMTGTNPGEYESPTEFAPAADLDLLEPEAAKTGASPPPAADQRETELQPANTPEVDPPPKSPGIQPGPVARETDKQAS